MMSIIINDVTFKVTVGKQTRITFQTEVGIAQGNCVLYYSDFT